MAAATDLWSLTQGRTQIDASELAAAIERQVAEPQDFRTQLLIRDSVDALRRFWTPPRFRQWLESTPAGRTIERIAQDDLEGEGFPSLKERIVDATRAETVRQYLRELGRTIHEETPIYIGGSIALILGGKLSRHTEDIDLVDEVPAALRSQHDLLHDLSSRYGLQLTHFQSHYLPDGWRERVHSLGKFGGLNVASVDIYDVFLSKLFSSRTKDLDDLRMLLPQLDKGVTIERLGRTSRRLQADAQLAATARANWYILWGEGLPK